MCIPVTLHTTSRTMFLLLRIKDTQIACMQALLNKVRLNRCTLKRFSQVTVVVLKINRRSVLAGCRCFLLLLARKLAKHRIAVQFLGHATPIQICSTAFVIMGPAVVYACPCEIMDTLRRAKPGSHSFIQLTARLGVFVGLRVDVFGLR